MERPKYSTPQGSTVKLIAPAPCLETPAVLDSLERGPALSDVLVAYASRTGMTLGAAVAIGEVITEAGHDCDIFHVNAPVEAANYKALVIGSAIRGGKPLPETIRFIQKNRKALAGKPVAFFVLSMTMVEDTEETRALVSRWIEPIKHLIDPADVALFAGGYEPVNVGLITRLLHRLGRFKPGDYRNWSQIRGWARSLPGKLGL